jgi:hypothetical protein
MLEKILDTILDNQGGNSILDIQQAPPDPLNWIDDIFSDGWMVSGPFVDGAAMGDISMYGSMDQDFQF